MARIAKGTGYAFDDVLLIPDYSDVLPREVNIESFITKDIKIFVPVVSAAMDTVTGALMAIEMARNGGVGIIHKNMSIAKQAEQVRMVKRSENGLIINPITLPSSATVLSAKKLMADNKIGGIPIVDSANKLVGILTNRDLRHVKNMKSLVSQVMTKANLVTAKEGTTMLQAKEILEASKIEKLPIVSSDNTLVGLITFRDIMQIESAPNACKSSHGQLITGAAVGVTTDMLERVEALINAGVDIITLDSAHGHSKGIIEAVKKIKNNFNVQLIAGNVATGNGARALYDAGADAVKVGIGPGSICTTRVVTGAGVPQLSAIMTSYEALKGTGVPIIADGGIRYTGDFTKAIAAGASTVMAGSIFAGTEESPGETIIFEGRKFKTYRGMGSMEAMNEGSRDRYFQDDVESDIKKLVPEGVVGRVPYKGNVSEVIQQFVGGLRAGMGYTGSHNILELQKNAVFCLITSAGRTENHPHDVIITKEAPNYSR